MKKIISLLTVAMLLVCVLTGCGGNKEAVATDGSTSMNKVIVALGEAFEADTGITVTYNATGSGAGIGWYIFMKRTNLNYAGMFAALRNGIIPPPHQAYLRFCRRGEER